MASRALLNGWALASGGRGSVAPTPLAISGTLPNGTRGVAYSFTPTVTGGQGDRRFRLAGGLPAGLTFNSGTGAITGTPTDEQFVGGIGIIVRDDISAAFLPGLTITINPAGSAPPGFELVTTLNGSDLVTSGGEPVYAKAA